MQAELFAFRLRRDSCVSESFSFENSVSCSASEKWEHCALPL